MSPCCGSCTLDTVLTDLILQRHFVFCIRMDWAPVSFLLQNDPNSILTTFVQEWNAFILRAFWSCGCYAVNVSCFAVTIFQAGQLESKLVVVVVCRTRLLFNCSSTPLFSCLTWCLYTLSYFNIPPSPGYLWFLLPRKHLHLFFIWFFTLLRLDLNTCATAAWQTKFMQAALSYLCGAPVGGAANERVKTSITHESAEEMWRKLGSECMGQRFETLFGSKLWFSEQL